MTQLEVLKMIAERDGGLLRPKAVVDEARDVASPLHPAFEWDDSIAGEKYRLEQAQRLIRGFKIVQHDGEKKFERPVFVGLSVDRTGDSGDNPYRLIDDLQKYPDLLAIAERDALEQLRGMKERYGHLKRLNDVWSAIEAHV